MTGSRAALRALAARFGPLTVRRPWLAVARLHGALRGRLSTGWGPAVSWLAVTAVVLLVLPPAINVALAAADNVGLWGLLDVPSDPRVGTWWTPERVLLVAAAVLLVRALARARSRVVIEEFVDCTSGDSEAVKGLATLLVAELGHLRELYGRVNQELSVPTSVGVHSQGGARGTEPGAFVSVRADEVTEVLSGAVATEVRVDVGPVRIPLGPLLDALGRIARGPRIVGSVHRSAAAGGPTLTIQAVGLQRGFTWRIDGPDDASGSMSKAFLNPMVSEAACRIFTDLTLAGSVRWRAIRAFTGYLNLYWASLRTPRNRAEHLKQAERRLLEAIAEDETFDLAYYNLGVVYDQLAQAERRAAEAADYGDSARVGAPAEGPRMEAAMGAFRQALALNRQRPEAFYALAVNEYTSVLDAALDEPVAARPGAYSGWRCAVDDAGRRQRDLLRDEALRRVVHLCTRVIELDPSHGQAYDLIGMAQSDRYETRLRLWPDDHARHVRLLEQSLRSHRRAVRRTWRTLCALEREQRARPDGVDDALDATRANAAAALRNLAGAHARLAPLSRSPRRELRWLRADRLFAEALALTPAHLQAHTHLERGREREERNRLEAAIASYRAAARVEPDSPLHWAHVRRAQARAGHHPSEDDGADGLEVSARAGLETCDRVLGRLAGVYRRSFEPLPPAIAKQICSATLDCLQDAAFLLADADEQERLREVCVLRDRLEQIEHTPPGELARLLDGLPEQLQEYGARSDREFEYEQLALALGRGYARAGDWDAAAAHYASLIGWLAERRPRAIAEHALHAKHAQALRNQRPPGSAHIRPAPRAGREAAIRAATRAVVQDPLSSTARRELGRAHVALLQFEDALATWQHAQRLTPNDPVLHFKIGFCHWSIAQDLREQGRRRQALAEAAQNFDQAALLAGPERLECWVWSRLWLGRVELERGDADRAGERLRAAWSTPATELPARLLTAEAYLANGEVWRSSVLFRRTFAQASDLRQRAGATALLDADWGDTLTAQEALARAKLGCAYGVALGSGELDRGLKEAELAAELAQGIPFSLRARLGTWARCLDLQARIELQRGDVDSALERATRAVALDPRLERLRLALRLYEIEAEALPELGARARLAVSARELVERLHRVEADGAAVAEADALLARLESDGHDGAVPANGRAAVVRGEPPAAI